MNDEWQKTLAMGARHLSNADPILAPIIASSPLPTLQPHKNYYQELVESIVSQQLSVTAAAAIMKRFMGLFSDEFPSPESILQYDIEAYRTVGLSRQKASYIRDLAEKVTDGSVVFTKLDTLSNQEIISELTAIKGVGVWTVHMFLMFCMGRLDILPSGDLGIRNGIQKLYALNERPDDQEIHAIAQKNKWHPYETLASWYVWRSLGNKPAL